VNTLFPFSLRDNLTQTDRLDAVLENEAFIIGNIILTEVFQGFKVDRDY